MRGALNQLGAIVERNDLHALREAALKRINLFLDAFDDIERVHTVACDHDSPDRLFSVAIQDADPERIAYLHVRNVAHVNGSARRSADHYVLDICQ